MPKHAIRSLCLTVAFTSALTSLSACARPAFPPMALPALDPSCRAESHPGQPVFCAPPGYTELFVVGLRSGDGFQQGDRAVLALAVPETGVHVPAAMVEVTERYRDFAEVRLIDQAEPRRLDGARARRLGEDERAPLGKHVGRVTPEGNTRVRLDLGVRERVAVGDVYAILSPRDPTPIGRIEITEVHDGDALGKRLDRGEDLRAPGDAVWLADVPAGAAAPLRLLVVSFDPEAPMDVDARAEGKRFAKDLVDALATLAKGSSALAVEYAGDLHVRLEAGEETAHEEARRIGAREGADVVVWGSMRCETQACVTPRISFVDPDRFRARSTGGELVREAERAGFALAAPPPADPRALAAAILGSACSEAQRFADARLFLTRALAGGALRGVDELRARLGLAYALSRAGQTFAARAQATRLTQRARALRAEDWEQWGRGELARSEALEGRRSIALAELDRIAAWARARQDADGLRFAMQEKAAVLARYEDEDEASDVARAYDERLLTLERLLALERSMGDAAGEARTLRALGSLKVGEESAESARALLQEALGIEERIGHVADEARTLHALGIMEAAYGRAEEARALFRRALEQEQRIGAVGDEAETERELGALEHHHDHDDEARAHFERSLALFRRRGDADGEHHALYHLAEMYELQRPWEEARAYYREMLDRARRRGEVTRELRTLKYLARLERWSGREEAALALYHRALILERRRGDLAAEARTLSTMAGDELRHGRTESARALFREACALQARAGDIKKELDTRMLLALLDNAQGERARARAAFLDVLARARAAGLVLHQLNVFMTITRWDIEEGSLVQARQRWEEAKALVSKDGNERWLPLVEDQLRALVPLERVAEAWRTHAETLRKGGVLLRRIAPEGQGAKAGLEAGDILLWYGAARLDLVQSATLEDLAKATRPGRAVRLMLLRGAEELTVQVHGGALDVEIGDLTLPKAAK